MPPHSHLAKALQFTESNSMDRISYEELLQVHRDRFRLELQSVRTQLAEFRKVTDAKALLVAESHDREVSLLRAQICDIKLANEAKQRMVEAMHNREIEDLKKHFDLKTKKLSMQARAIYERMEAERAKREATVARFEATMLSLRGCRASDDFIRALAVAANKRIDSTPVTPENKSREESRSLSPRTPSSQIISPALGGSPNDKREIARGDSSSYDTSVKGSDSQDSEGSTGNTNSFWSNSSTNSPENSGVSN